MGLVECLLSHEAKIAMDLGFSLYYVFPFFLHVPFLIILFFQVKKKKEQSHGKRKGVMHPKYVRICNTSQDVHKPKTRLSHEQNITEY